MGELRPATASHVASRIAYELGRSVTGRVGDACPPRHSMFSGYAPSLWNRGDVVVCFAVLLVAGLVSAVGASACAATCPVNTGVASTGSKQCIPCLPGYFSNGSALACSQCAFRFWRRKAADPFARSSLFLPPILHVLYVFFAYQYQVL